MKTKKRMLITGFTFLSVLLVAAERGSCCCDDPIADLTASPTPVCVGYSVQFDATGSYDPDCSSCSSCGGVSMKKGIRKFEWDWTNNGSYDHTESPGDGKASHIYTTPGTYTCKVRVTDDDDDCCCSGSGCDDKTDDTTFDVEVKSTDCSAYTLFSGELTSAQNTIESALNAIPCTTASGVSVGGSISGDLCSCCSDDGEFISDAVVTGNGSAGVGATLTGALPGLSWSWNFTYHGNGVQGNITIGPTIAGTANITASVDVEKFLDDDCDGDDCLTAEACGSISVTMGLAATASASAQIGWWNVSATFNISATVTGSAKAEVDYASEDCPSVPDPAVTGVLGSFTGVVYVNIPLWMWPDFNWDSPTFTFYTGGNTDC